MKQWNKIAGCMLFLIFTIGYANAQYEVASKRVSGKKSVTTTKWAPGFIMDMNGEKRQGEIQLKIVNSDTVEVRLKQGDVKEKFERFAVQYFGLELKADYFKTYKLYRKNFHEGYVIYNDGKELRGRVALRFTPDFTGKLGGNGKLQTWKVYVALLENTEKIVGLVKPEQAIEVGQKGPNGKMVRFIKYDNVWTEVLIESDNYTMKHVPFPDVVDPKKTRKANNWNTFISSEAAARKAGGEAKVSGHSGGGIITIYGDEYEIEKKGREKVSTVNEDNFWHWMDEEFKNCEAYTSLKNKYMRKYRKWENFEMFMKWANEHCK